MGKVFKRLKAIVITLGFLVLSNSYAFASSEVLQPVLKSNFTNVPTEHQLKIMEENTREYPIKEDITTLEITPEGYQRKYGEVVFDTRSIINRHKFIGQVSAYNKTSTSGTLQYRQDSTVTTKWSVSSSVSGNAEISAPFLSKIKADLGVTVGSSITTSKTSTVSYTSTVRPGRTGYIDAYHKAGYGSGYIKWWDYTPTGVLVRTGKTTVSGNTIVKNSVHYDAYEK